MLQTIFDFVIWIFVPLILALVIKHVYSLTKVAQDPRHVSTMRAGFWGGFVLFIMALIYQVGIFVRTGFPHNEIFQGFNVPLAITGAILGFILFSGGKRVLPAKLSGWIVLVVTFVTCSALLHYLFIRTYNEVFLSLILGITFGMLAHFTTSPASLQDFLNS